MSNTRRIKHSDPAYVLYARVTKYCIAMRDDIFDQWLKVVVLERAKRGSVRAKEMLAFEEKVQADEAASQA